MFGDARDKIIQEMEERVYPDGRIAYFPPANIIDAFEKAGADNPYPGPKGFDGLYDRVNPNFGELGTTNNCALVGAAMQIASLGYDVVAGKSLGGVRAEAFEKWFDGAETQECHNFTEMKEDFLSFGDGASGVLQGYYGKGLGDNKGGHTLHWRNENGDIIVADGQDHTEWNFDEIVGEYKFGDGGCLYTRLDDCKPNWDALSEDGVIAVNNPGRRWKNKQTGDIYSKF